MILSLDALKAIYATETSDYPILLLTLSHPDLAASLYFSTDPTTRLPAHTTDENVVYGTISGGVEYIYVPMEISLPTESKQAAPQTSISVSNVGREMVTAIRSLSGKPTLGMKFVLASNTDSPEGEMNGFRFAQVDINRSKVTGTLILDVLINEPFCYLLFTPSTAPGIFK